MVPNGKKSTDLQLYSAPKVARIHQHAKLEAIPTIWSPGNAGKPQIPPVSLSQNCTKIRKNYTPKPQYNQSWRWSGYISIQNFRPFLSCVLREISGNRKFDPFHKVKIALKLAKISRPWLKACQFWRCLGCNSMPNCRSFFPCVFKEMPGYISGRTGGPTDPCTGGNIVFRTLGGQSENGSSRRGHENGSVALTKYVSLRQRHLCSSGNMYCCVNLTHAGAKAHIFMSSWPMLLQEHVVL